MKNKAQWLSAVPAVVACATPLLADDNKQAVDEPVLQEIIVTASKRAVSVQDTPYNVSALSGQSLADLKIQSPVDLVKAVPGVVVSDSGARFRNALDIRGVGPGTGASDFFTTEATAYYVGETALENMNLRVKDLERLEVLRGPQGTLYGAGSLGGTVRYILNRADPKRTAAIFSLDGSKTEGAEAISHDVDAVINVPLIADKLAVRVVASHFDTKGFIDYRTYPDEAASGFLPDRVRKNYNDETVKFGRVSLGWIVNDGWRLDAAYTRQKQTAWGRQGYTLDGPGNNPGTGVNHDFINDHTVAGFNDEVSNRDIELLQFDLDGDVGFADLHVNLSRYRDRYNTQGDITRFLESLAGGVYASFDALNGYNDNRINSVNNSAEVRLLSKRGGAIDWVGGVYFIKQDRRWDLVEYTPGLNDFVLGPNSGVAPNDFALLSNGRFTQAAAYGEGTWHANNKLDLTVGLRYFDMKDRIELGIWYPIYQGLSGWGDPATAASYFPGPDGNGNQNYRKLYSKLNVSYKLSNDALVYATFSQGFRRGGANATGAVQFVPGGDLQEVLKKARFYKPDTLNNYEIGFKSEWFDRRFIFNAAVYYLDWKNRQVFSDSIKDSAGNVVTLPISQRVNVGSATSKGVELETRFQASKSLELRGGVAYNTIHDNNDQGFRFSGKPAWQGNAGLTHQSII